tara:strand:- start:50532 stop:51299 length:768 start_codon:yes stop_codon:yes gene_type:complete
MKKKYFLLFTLVSFTFSFHVKAQTLTFTSDAGSTWDDGIATDGEGGSTDISGLTIEVYNVDNSLNTINEMEWYPDLGTSNGFYGLTTYNFSGDGSFKGQIVKESTGLEFQINGFDWYDWGNNNSQSMTVTGYKNGAEVATKIFVGNGNPNSVYVSLNSDFDNVDEVRILTTSGTTYPSINNIEIGGAVLNIKNLQNEGFQVMSKNNRFESNKSETTIEVYNILGQKLENKDLSSGVYILKVMADGYKPLTLKRYI